MTTIVYPHGSSEVTVSASSKIAVYSDAPYKIYTKSTYSTQPASWDLLTSQAAGTAYTSSAFSASTDVRVEAGGAAAYYNTGTSPSAAALQLVTSQHAALTTVGVASLSTAQTQNLTTTQLTNLCTNMDAIIGVLQQVKLLA